jgi:hypothetical protein
VERERGEEREQERGNRGQNNSRAGTKKTKHGRRSCGSVPFKPTTFLVPIFYRLS